MDTITDPCWQSILSKIYPSSISVFLEKEREDFEILPPQHLIFNAFNHCSFEATKVVILGQDAYPTKGHAMGLSFSVPVGTRCPPSLRNIFKELEAEYAQKRTNTDLTDWANQGVLLLNTALTVREGSPGSHIKVWKEFTRDVIAYIAKNKKNICYILWGEHAKSYIDLLDHENNCILTHTHPSPLSRKPFTGCNHFKLCNEYLESTNQSQIVWL